MQIHGILNLNKPEGRTSFSIIGQLRRLSGEKRIGHTGTLDPFASGVLPVCIGQACKISRFISESSKAYSATIELGISTDTYDRDGKVTEKKDLSRISKQTVYDALNSLKGTINQVPPMYSAIKIGGKKSFRMARSGIKVRHKPRIITINKIEMTGYELPFITVDVECSKGTYIRSLANDLGQILGCGAYLKNLVRTRCGIFSIENAVPMKKLEEAFANNSWRQYLLPPDFALTGWDKVTIDNKAFQDMLDGKGIDIGRSPSHRWEYVRAYNSEGKMVAILNFDQSRNEWRHEKLFQY
jgi:tRNA pseudouridine55 synthase